MAAEPSRLRRRDLLLLAGVLALVLVVAGAWLFVVTAPRRALLGLPPAERAELFARTRAQAEAVCSRHEAVFEDECRHQLELLVAFPECDADCQRFARSYLVRPVR